MNDPRPDGLLLESGRIGQRLGLAYSWTDSLEGPGAKACSRGGSANWKRGQRLPQGSAGEAFFLGRARKRNPVVVASASGLVLVEVDLDVPDDAYPELDEVKARVGATLRRLGLRFPRSVVVRSRRGLHFYFRPAPGCPPAKVQIVEAGDEVTFVGDGYLVAVPALHELSGVVYQYVHDDGFAELPA